MATTVAGVTQATVSLTSTSSPVSLMPPGTRLAGFVFRNRSGSACKCLVFTYTGTLPGSPSSDVFELDIGSTLNDQLVSASMGMDTMLNVGWAAVLESAGSATVDVIYR